jgi:hypothetical protein
MLISVAIFALVLSAQTTQTTQIYTDPDLGLSFSHPSTWLLEKANDSKQTTQAKKKKKKKGDTGVVDFRIPLTGAAEDADLQIMRASFSGSPETWQTIQTNANKDLHRQVQKQWQEEILGVPMLLTQIDFTNNGTNETTVTGLLYNDSPDKLLFRLTGPTSDFDKAQFEFEQALQTLRTTNNEMPKAQDPDHPATGPAHFDPRGQKHPLFVPDVPRKYKIAPVSVPLVVSTKKVEIHVPAGWRAEHVDGGGFELRSAELPYPIVFHVASSLDSEPAGNALIDASAASLADFSAVQRREDTVADVNDGGCTVTSVWRTGTGAKGPLVTMESAGAEGDFYFVATCRPTPGPSLAAQRKAIDSLLAAISIQPGA